MMRLRNSAAAFNGTLQIAETPSNELDMTWSDGESTITLKANLESMDFSISHSPAEGETQVYTYPKP
jgi:sucrose phosphorylase